MRGDLEEPGPARPATRKDPGDPDPAGFERHELTHWPAKPWCAVCVSTRGRDAPLREHPRIDASVPLVAADTGYMGDGDPNPLGFVAATDSSSGMLSTSAFATKTTADVALEEDQSCLVTALARWVSELGYRRFTLQNDGEPAMVSLLDKVATKVFHSDEVGQAMTNHASQFLTV